MIGCDCAVCRSNDPHDKRWRPSIVVDDEEGRRVLVDTTPDLRMQALRFGVRRVDAIVYTHSHADHVMGLDEVRRYNMLQKTPMAIFGDPHTLDEVRQTFRYVFESNAPRGGGVPDLRLWPIGGEFMIGRLPVLPLRIQHGPWQILGFRFGPFAYLTDCNGVPDETLAQLGGLDTLVLDALRHTPHPTHFTVAQAVDMARRIGARRTYFTHIAHELGHAATNAQLPAGMALAHDGLELEFPAGAAAR